MSEREIVPGGYVLRASKTDDCQLPNAIEYGQDDVFVCTNCFRRFRLTLRFSVDTGMTRNWEPAV